MGKILGRIEMEQTSTELNKMVITRQHEAPGWRERYARLIMTGGMMASDLVGLLAAGGLAIAARWVVLGPFMPDLVVWFGPVAVLMIILFSTRKLYPGIGLGVVEEFRSLTIGISLMFIMVSAISLILQEGEELSRFVFVGFWMASMVSIPALRRVTRHVMTKANLWGEPTVIIGPIKAGVRLYKYFKSDPKIGLKPVVMVSTRGNGRNNGIDAPVYPIERVGEVCQQRQIRTAAVLFSQMDQVEAITARYREVFEHLALFSTNGNNHYLNKVSIQHYGGLVSLAVHHRLLDPWAQACKRMMDLAISGLAMVVLWPFYLVGAGLICLDSPGPIFYRQVRVGKRGKPFIMYKLRTMYVNADEVLSSTLEKDPAQKEEWDKYQKLRKDPRITRVGRILRRFSIDEIAQLWNVLRGEMSLVGPRPIMVNQRKLYGENYQHYVRVVPGISGLWQINGRSQMSFLRRAEMDMEYVISWSMWMDIYIIIRTIWVVLNRRGAY
jgi:Undecaprenyl-phosphate galactose phosphotransferase WbaP